MCIKCIPQAGLEAVGFSKHAAVVIMWRQSFAFDVCLKKTMVMADEGKSHGASVRQKVAIKGDGGVNLGEGGR